MIVVVKSSTTERNYVLMSMFAKDLTRVGPTRLLQPQNHTFAPAKAATILVSVLTRKLVPERDVVVKTVILRRPPATFADRCSAAAATTTATITINAYKMHFVGFQLHQKTHLAQEDSLWQTKFWCLTSNDRLVVPRGFDMLGDPYVFGNGSAVGLATAWHNYTLRALWLANPNKPFEDLTTHEKRALVAWTLQGAACMYCDGGMQLKDTRGLPDETFGVRKDCDGMAVAVCCFFTAVTKFKESILATIKNTDLFAEYSRPLLEFATSTFCAAGLVFALAVTPGVIYPHKNHGVYKDTEIHQASRPACITPFGHALAMLVCRKPADDPLLIETTAVTTIIGEDKLPNFTNLVKDNEYGDMANAFRDMLHARGIRHGAFFAARRWVDHHADGGTYAYKFVSRVYFENKTVDGADEKSNPDPNGRVTRADLRKIQERAAMHNDKTGTRRSVCPGFLRMPHVDGTTVPYGHPVTKLTRMWTPGVFMTQLSPEGTQCGAVAAQRTDALNVLTSEFQLPTAEKNR